MEQQTKDKNYIPKTLEECLKMKRKTPHLVRVKGIVRGVVLYEDKHKDKDNETFYGFLQQDAYFVKFVIYPGFAFAPPLMSMLRSSSESDKLITVRGIYYPINSELNIREMSLGVYKYSKILDNELDNSFMDGER